MLNEEYLSNLSNVLRIGAIKQSGLKIVMPIEANRNHVDIIYAGSLCMLGEIMGGVRWAVMFDVAGFFPIAKELFIKFVRPATTDIFIEQRFSGEEAKRIQEEAQEFGKCDYRMKLELKAERSNL